MKISYFFPPWKSSLASKKELYAFGMCVGLLQIKLEFAVFFLEKEMVCPKGMRIPLKRDYQVWLPGQEIIICAFDRNWANEIF